MSAHDTLLEHLSARQRADYLRFGAFQARGSGWFGRKYWISKYDQAIYSWRQKFWGNCGSLWHSAVSPEDTILALKLLIESNERWFRKRACRG